MNPNNHVMNKNNRAITNGSLFAVCAVYHPTSMFIFSRDYCN